MMLFPVVEVKNLPIKGKSEAQCFFYFSGWEQQQYKKIDRNSLSIKININNKEVQDPGSSICKIKNSPQHWSLRVRSL